jgi:inosine/xanthosine triphosphate pyrophosphatase family protein
MNLFRAVPLRTAANGNMTTLTAQTKRGIPFPNSISIVFATNENDLLQALRSALADTRAEVLSLTDIRQPEPIQDGRNLRESAAMGAAVIAARTGRLAISIARSFTIDPLFSYSPAPELSATRDYPTWTWRIPPSADVADLVKEVNAADRELALHGYCGPDDRGAYFLTTLCATGPDRDPHFVEEWCDGQFFFRKDATTPDQSRFDFAMCLVPQGQTVPLAMLDDAERSRRSDVGKAMRTFRNWLMSEPMFEREG